MWWSSNQQRHARGAMYGWAFLQYTLLRGMGVWLLVPFALWIGYLNHWFEYWGWAPHVIHPMNDSTDYILRGRERIKSPFTWQEGVWDIETAIQMNSKRDGFNSKFSLSSNYFDLARAYGIHGNKNHAVQSLNRALIVSRESELKAVTKVNRDAAISTSQMTAAVLRQCLGSNCKDFWIR